MFEFFKLFTANIKFVIDLDSENINGLFILLSFDKDGEGKPL